MRTWIPCLFVFLLGGFLHSPLSVGAAEKPIVVASTTQIAISPGRWLEI